MKKIILLLAIFISSGFTNDTSSFNSIEEKACFNKEIGLCYEVAVKYLIPDNYYNLDIDKGLEVANFACSNNDITSCGLLSTFYMNYSIFQDKNKSMSYMKKACDLGGYEACMTIAFHYYYGDMIVEKDEKEFAKYIDKSCEFGVLYACTLMATFYENGDIYSKNETKRDEYLNKSCTDGQSVKNMSGCITIMKIFDNQEKALNTKIYNEEIQQKYYNKVKNMIKNANFDAYLGEALELSAFAYKKFMSNKTDENKQEFLELHALLCKDGFSFSCIFEAYTKDDKEKAKELVYENDILAIYAVNSFLYGNLVQQDIKFVEEVSREMCDT
ncbi:MAG: tetratricopeptide repeat protein, partial [Campylobacteraceae bacterium]